MLVLDAHPYPATDQDIRPQAVDLARLLFWVDRRPANVIDTSICMMACLRPLTVKRIHIYSIDEEQSSSSPGGPWLNHVATI